LRHGKVAGKERWKERGNQRDFHWLEVRGSAARQLSDDLAWREAI
jgi:hypothetical protein